MLIKQKRGSLERRGERKWINPRTAGRKHSIGAGSYKKNIGKLSRFKGKTWSLGRNKRGEMRRQEDLVSIKRGEGKPDERRSHRLHI